MSDEEKEYDYKQLYIDLLQKYDKSESKLAQARQKILMFTLESVSIRESKAWELGKIVGEKIGKDEVEEGFCIENPFDAERKAYGGLIEKKKHV